MYKIPYKYRQLLQDQFNKTYVSKRPRKDKGLKRLKIRRSLLGF